MVTVTLSPEALTRLDAIALERGQTRSGAIEEMVFRARLAPRCVECGQMAGAVCTHCGADVCYASQPTACGLHPCGLPRGPQARQGALYVQRGRATKSNLVKPPLAARRRADRKSVV